jgi:hypothetical protein
MMSILHLLIPVLGLLVPIVAIVAYYWGSAYRARLRHETVRELARAGVPIPPELLADLRDGGGDWATNRASYSLRLLLGATVNLGLGLGLIGMFATQSPGSWLWSIGLIPTCLGVALGLLWFWLRRQSPTS